MSISDFELRLAEYLQEKGVVAVDKVCRKFQIQPARLRRAAQNLNALPPARARFAVDKNLATSALTYDDYIRLVQSLTMDDYAAAQSERGDIMLSRAFFRSRPNASDPRQDPSGEVSPSAKALFKQPLTGRMFARFGARTFGKIADDEARLRALIVSLLAPTLELDAGDKFTPNPANTPPRRILCDEFIEKAAPAFAAARTAAQAYLEERGARLTYAGKKIFYIYLCAALCRTEQGFFLAPRGRLVPSSGPCDLLPNAAENECLSDYSALLDRHESPPPPEDAKLKRLAENLIADARRRFAPKLDCSDRALAEIYGFLYRSILRNHWNLRFPGDKPPNPKKQFSQAIAAARPCIRPVEEAYGQKFSDAQIAALALTVKRLVNERSAACQNQKRIVVVSDSASEINAYFVSVLKNHIDLASVGVVHIGEPLRLRTEPCDALVAFSDRICARLAQAERPCVKLNFHLSRTDVDKLLRAGFSSAKRKLSVDRFIDEIAGMTKAETKARLIARYPEYFY